MAMKMVDLMKLASQASAVLLYVLRGRKADNSEWVNLQSKYPHSLGPQRINSLLSGGMVNMRQLKFKRSASNMRLEQARVLTNLPASFQQVINEVRDMEMAVNKGQLAEAAKDTMSCLSPMAQKCTVTFFNCDCTSANMSVTVPRGPYKGFTASVNFGYNQYTGDEKCTSMEDVKSMVRQCHNMTTKSEYFIMLSCRANDREHIFKILTESRPEQNVKHFTFLFLSNISTVAIIGRICIVCRSY